MLLFPVLLFSDVPFSFLSLILRVDASIKTMKMFSLCLVLRIRNSDWKCLHGKGCYMCDCPADYRCYII